MFHTNQRGLSQSVPIAHPLSHSRPPLSASSSEKKTTTTIVRFELWQLAVLRRAYACFANTCSMEGLQRVRTLLQDEVELFTAAGASLPPFCLSPFLPLPTSAVVKIASLPLILFSLLCHWAFFFCFEAFDKMTWASVCA